MIKPLVLLTLLLPVAAHAACDGETYVDCPTADGRHIQRAAVYKALPGPHVVQPRHESADPAQGFRIIGFGRASCLSWADRKAPGRIPRRPCGQRAMPATDGSAPVGLSLQ